MFDAILAVLTPPRRRALAAALVVLLVVVVGARRLASAGTAAQPVAAPVRVAAPAAARRVLVHVAGAVRRPGLYRLEEGDRVADALARAGGPTRRADLAAVNLAAPVADGTQVLVPRRVAAGAASAPTSPGAARGPVRLNVATVEELDTLPGIGPVTAQKIVDWRQAHGAFRGVDDLDAVPGIGPARIEQLRELVTP
ncbi:MAG TPA: ComEA family DNA-binding protein [Gaiellaceae bacterium]|nr:ComEA family DNA-binding protein [Gaiellaceae bacterium]